MTKDELIKLVQAQSQQIKDLQELVGNLYRLEQKRLDEKKINQARKEGYEIAQVERVANESLEMLRSTYL